MTRDLAKFEIWFDFASSYSYLTLQTYQTRLYGAAAEAVRLRPFLLGPLFAARGWSTSPFRLQPDKGAHMTRDIARRSRSAGLPFLIRDDFPARSSPAARLAITALDLDPEAGAAFCRAVSRAAFAEGRDISETAVLQACAAAAAIDMPALAAATATDAEAPKLRAATEQAARGGLFGAPTMLIRWRAATGEERAELFWGDEQLERAAAAYGRLA